MFLIFGKSMIKYIELKAIERENLYNDREGEEEDDDDILFDTEKMEETESEETADLDKPNPEIFDIFSLEKTLPIKRDDIQSFWGNKILRKDIIENTVLEETNEKEKYL